MESLRGSDGMAINRGYFPVPGKQLEVGAGEKYPSWRRASTLPRTPFWKLKGLWVGLADQIIEEPVVVNHIWDRYAGGWGSWGCFP